jgi:hypothetical protein
MAQYLIIHEDSSINIAEAKTMRGAADGYLRDEETATIYRLAGPGKTVTAKVEQLRSIEISDEVT